ncbi:MAG: DUF4349 domain-containing protein [Candidatus Hydrogenedentes bacterium]|nr:DUF4349 domain-containing protein [Candidatus Hydrogenedentota bacterium]
MGKKRTALMIGALAVLVLVVSCGPMDGAGRAFRVKDAPAEAIVAYDAAFAPLSPAPQPGRERRTLGQADYGGAESSNALGYAEGADKGDVALGTMAAAQPDRYLIKNAAIAIEVEDARAACQALMTAVEGAGGYVGELSETVNVLGQRTVTLQIRVPADRFEQTMLDLDALGKVMNRQVRTEDVTEEFVDTEAKLRNLKRTEERVLDHLNRTGDLEDIVLIEKELSRYREEIERFEGRLRFLEHRVSFSTIHVSLKEKPGPEPLVPPKSFSTSRVVSEAVRALIEFAQRLWVKIIWIGVWAPVWAPIGVVFVILCRVLRRRRVARRKQKKEPGAAAGS